MCSIDGPFGPHPLDEKTDPTERFSQALDEYGAKGDFRRLLEKHFSITWPNELGDIEKVEAALKCARQDLELPKKITSFVQAIKIYDFERLQIDFVIKDCLDFYQKRYPERFAFARDVAIDIFFDSPYGFYQCFKGKSSVLFESFILFFTPSYYGGSCQLTKLLFNDSNLDALGNDKREELLWSLFESMQERDCTFAENLMNVFTWEFYSSVPTSETLRFLSSYEYLSSWLEADSQSRDSSESKNLLTKKIRSYISDRMDEIFFLKKEKDAPWEEDELQEFKKWSDKWLDHKYQELSKAWCCSVKLNGMPQEVFEYWAEQAYKVYLPLCPELGKEQVEALIVWELNNDFRRLLDSKLSLVPFLEICSNSKIWYVSPFQESWRASLIFTLNNLSFEDRLKTFSRRFGSVVRIVKGEIPHFIFLPPENLKTSDDHGLTDESYQFLVSQEDRDWWDSLLRKLPDDPAFPKELYPIWTIKALTRFGINEYLASFADKSIGIVRGSLNEKSDSVATDQLEKLLGILERFAPEKALRHRLMLLRASLLPCTKENLDLDRDSLCPSTMSEILKKFMGQYFQHSSRRGLRSHDEWDREELQFLISFRTWFAEYCLSRLRLRKGERVENDFYMPEQVVEQSSVWRQGYLMALAELGVDLQGKAHKTLHFTREYDPDEVVRTKAQECYKAVRREKNKSQSAVDIRRGLTAAYWWLLVAQRQFLGVHIEGEEARQTRRRLLRRP